MLENKQLLADKANNLATQLAAWRRHLHQFPELSFQEFETARFISEQLSNIEGMQVESGIAGTGVVGTLKKGSGPTIAIRADIDALPIHEENVHEYRSKREGVMHACGHDAHPSIALGAAILLAELFKNNDIQGTVKFIFQPAEECTDEHGLSGAPYMIEAGVLKEVDAILALHMCPWLPVGEVQMNDGYSMANVDVFNAKIYGTGGHGAYPETGTDPIWMLGPVLQAVHGIVARRISPLEPAVISIGQVHAGTASNIIPTEVSLEGTIRSYSDEARDLLGAELRRAFSIVENLGGHFKLDIENGEPSLYNDSIINSWLEKTMIDMYPKMKIHRNPFGLGGEDFGYMTREVPGAMFFLGCSIPDEVNRELHTPNFDIDERCLPIGTAILAETARRFLKGEYARKQEKSGGVL